MRTIIPQGKLPFVILDVGNLTSIQQLIDWAFDKNKHPIHIVVLSDYSSNDQLHILYLKKLQKRGDIDLIRIPNKNPSIISKLDIVTLSPYYIFTKSNIVPKKDCPNDLLIHLMDGFRENPHANKIGTYLGTGKTIPHKSGKFIIGEVGSDFALYKRNQSKFNIKKGNLITKYPYRTKIYVQESKTSSCLYPLKVEEKVQKKMDISHMAIRKNLKNKVYTHKTAKDVDTEITFVSDTMCKGWKDCTGDVQIKGRRARIKWRKNQYGTDVIDFDESFSRYSGLSTKNGRITGIVKDNSIKRNLVNTHMLPPTPIQPPVVNHKKVEVVDYTPLIDNLFVVVAAFNLSDALIRKFIIRNQDAFNDNDVRLILVSNRKPQISAGWIDTVVYNNPEKFWSLSKVLNYGIRGVCNIANDNAIIIKSDIDILFSSNSLKNIKENVKPNHGLVSLCSHISENQISTLQTIDWASLEKDKGGKGAAFAMTVSDWIRLYGYNENLKGWGHDDTDLWHRAIKHLSVKIESKHPIFHIKHTPRKNDKFPNKAHDNEQIMKSGVVWDDKEWGKNNGQICDIDLGNQKLITFVMCLKNRAAAARKSIESLVTERSIPLCKFIIVEDYSENLLDLSAFRFKDQITHYVINTGDRWNRSKTLNYGFKRATTKLVASWDSDFEFKEDFCEHLYRTIKKVDFDKTLFRIDSVESEESTILGKVWKKGSIRGGQWVYKLEYLKQLNGYDEKFKDWGHEEMDFHERCDRAFGMKILESSKIDPHMTVTHISHSDNMRGESVSNKNYSIRDMHKKEKTTIVNSKGWGNSAVIKNKIRAKLQPKLDLENYGNFLRGRSVALIGPAPTIAGSNQSEYINSFDVVIRLNKAIPIPKSIADDTGARCDVLYNCLNKDPESGGILNLDQLEKAGIKWVCCPYAPTEDGFKRDIEYFVKINNGRFPFHHIDTKLYLNMQSEVKCRPNTGIGTIVDILNYRISQLYITGFTFFKGGYHKDYRGYSEKHVMDFMASHGNHKQAPQENLIRSLYKKDKRIIVDKALKKILEGK